MPNGMSIADFASAVKARDQRLASVPDDVLVRKVLDRRPELATRLTNPPAAPPVPSALTGQNPFMTRVTDRISDTAEGMSKLPSQFAATARDNWKQGERTGGGMGVLKRIVAIPRAEGTVLGGMAKGALGTTSPGIVSRLAGKEDPANIVADAALMMIPAGEPSGVAAKATEAIKSEMTPSIVGAHTRALEGFRTVERNAGHVPVDPAPVMQWVAKAEELAQKGYRMPKVMSDFQSWIESKSKGGAVPTAPTGPTFPSSLLEASRKSFMDTPGTSMPLTVRDAREFYTAMNEAIPWDEEGYGGKGGRMHYIVDQARKALQGSTTDALAPYGLDKTLSQAMSDYSRVARWREKSYGVGWLGGKIAGYGVGGAVTGHPLMMGALGGKAGEGIAGRMVKSVTEAGGGTGR
jgi:hypothetical protein